MMHNSKLFMLPCILLVLSVLPGCSKIGDLFGETRTVPADSKVNFDNKRSPALNPGGDGSVPVDDSKATPAASVPVADSQRHVPVENGMAAAPVTAENGSYPPLSSVPPMPQHQTNAQNTADMNALSAEHELSESARQELMNDKTATVMTSPQTGQLVDNAAAPVMAPSAMSGRKTPMENPQASVSPSAMPVASAPTYEQVVSAPAPVATAPHNVMTNGNVTAHTTAPVPSVMAASDPYIDQAGASAPTTQAAMEPVHLHPPVVTAPVAPAPLPASAPAPMTQADNAPIHLHPPIQSSMQSASPAPLEPVHLHAPNQMAMGSSGQVATATSTYSDAVNLVPPQSADAGKTQYLSDSRYASRRSYVPADDSSY